MPFCVAVNAQTAATHTDWDGVATARLPQHAPDAAQTVIGNQRQYRSIRLASLRFALL